MNEHPSDPIQSPHPPINGPIAGADLPLSKLQSDVDHWIRTIGVRYFSELTNLAILMEETGELARLFARRFGEQSEKQTPDPTIADEANHADPDYSQPKHPESAAQAHLADEMADILFVLVCLANQTGVDLTQAMRENLEKKTRRDAQRHRSNPKLKS